MKTRFIAAWIILLFVFCLCGLIGGNGGGGKGLGIENDSSEEQEGSSGIIDSWNEWNEWSECSNSCGDGGMKVRYRTCNHGNNDIATVCQGQSVQIKPCHVQSC